MRGFGILTVGALAGALAAGGCAPIGPERPADEPEISCFTQPQGGCSFSQSPLQVLNEPVQLPKRPYKFFPTAAPLNFVDAKGQGWTAPTRTLTDGASIPAIFVKIVGEPTAPEFINAAAVHDAYCGIGNEAGTMYHRAPWEEVHVMFYNGLIVGGTDHIRAKVMFAAVWLGGPRWAAPTGAVISTQGQTDAIATRFRNPLDRVPVWRKQAAMARVKVYIEGTEPTLPQLLAYLRRAERMMLREFPVLQPDSDAHSRSYTDEVYDPTVPGEVVSPTPTPSPGAGGVSTPITGGGTNCDGPVCP